MSCYFQVNIVNWLLDPEKGGLGDTYTAQEVNRAIGGVLIMKIKMKTLLTTVQDCCRPMPSTWRRCRTGARR